MKLDPVHRECEVTQCCLFGDGAPCCEVHALFTCDCYGGKLIHITDPYDVAAQGFITDSDALRPQ